MFEICTPTIIYIAFSLTQVIIDTLKGLYNTALFQTIVMILVSILLNALCERGMSVVAWMIVFIPFIFMSVIVAMLLYIFGLDAATGKNKQQPPKATGNLIYSQQIIKPSMAMTTTTLTPASIKSTIPIPPTNTTDPQQY